MAERLLRQRHGHAGRPSGDGTGSDLAFVELVAEPELEGIDARFLQRQTTGMLISAFSTITMALLAGRHRRRRHQLGLWGRLPL